MTTRMYVTSDGHAAFRFAADGVFGQYVDFALLIKLCGTLEGRGNEKRYSPADCTSTKPVTVTGLPDETHVSTSHDKRQNLTTRMAMQRYTRFSNSFSKKLENHCYVITIRFEHYNWFRIQETFRVTPAIEAGLPDDVMTIADVGQLAYPDSK